MQYITGLFKNTYEKCFNVSGLRIEKDPIYTSVTEPVRYIIPGTYQEKQILLYICNPQPIIKQLLLVKHPGLLSIHLYKDNVSGVEVGGQKIAGSFICCVTSSYQKINYQQLHYLEALHFLHDVLEAFQFLYEVLKLQVKSIDTSSFVYSEETQVYCFIDLSSVCQGNGMSEQDLLSGLFQLLNSQSQLNISTQKKGFSKMLKSNLFTDPSYQTYMEINKPGKLKDSLYLKELQALIERTSPSELFQGLINKLLEQIKQDKEVLKSAYHLLIIAINIILKQKKDTALLQNKLFNETCQIICKSIQSDPQTFIMHFLQLENLDKLQKQSAEYFTSIFIFFLEKRQQSSSQQQTQIYIIQLIQFAAQNFAKASILFLQHCNNNVMQKLYNHFVYHIQFYAQDYKSLISWNLYLTISNLRNYHDKNPGGLIGLSIQDFWKYKINEQCLRTLEQGTYDFIQALNLLNSAIPDSIKRYVELKIPFVQLGYVMQNINSVKSLHQGILSGDPKRREVSKKLYEKCVRIGIAIQAKNEEKDVRVSENIQTKQSILTKLGNYTIGNKQANDQQDQQEKPDDIIQQDMKMDLAEETNSKDTQDTESSSMESSNIGYQVKKQNQGPISKQQNQLYNRNTRQKQPPTQSNAWDDFSDDSS